VIKEFVSFTGVVFVLLFGMGEAWAQFNITTNTTNSPQTTAVGNNQVQPGVTLTLNTGGATSTTVTISGAHTFTNGGTTSSSVLADASNELHNVVLVSGASAILNNNGLIRHSGDAVNGGGARTINAIQVTASGLLLTNAGTISTTGTNFSETMQTISVNSSGMTVTNNAGAFITSVSAAAPVFNLTAAATGFVLNNSGTVEAFGASRGLDTASGDLGTLTITNLSTGIIRANGDDALRIRGGTTVNLTNDGQIIALTPDLVTSLPPSSQRSGQALDFASAEGGTINNNVGALIRADGADAVRLGSNQILNNRGTILGNSTVNDSVNNNGLNTSPPFNVSPSNSTTERFSTSEGVSFEDGAGSTLNNFGSISGSRHGVESAELATNVVILNDVGATITGRNGSGIGFDSTSTSATNVRVTNNGTITGAYAGAGNVIDRTGSLSPYQDGDGDGIDIDGSVTIINNGLIQGTGAGGFDSGGRANNSEGIAIGGGVITNNATGIIRGAGRAIIANNDSNSDRRAAAATTITNAGRIEGQNGFAIRFEGTFNDSITNTGTIIGTGAIADPLTVVRIQNGTADPLVTGAIDPANGTADGVVLGAGSTRFIRGDGSAIQTGGGNDTLDNTGTISTTNGRAVNLEGGNDTMIVRKGSNINGLVNGGTHATGDTLELHINGLTAQKTLDLQAGMVVVIGGISFQNFELISGLSTSQSYEQLATSPTAKGVGAVLDNLQAGANTNTMALIDKVDTSTDPNKSLEELTPTSLEGLTNIAFNNASFNGQFLNQRVDNIINDGPQFDVAGLRVWDRALSRSLQQTQYWLADVGQAQAMTDTGKIVAPAPAPVQDKRWGFFLNGGVEFGDQDATGTLPDSDYTTASVVLGIDYRVTENFVLGLFGGYSNTDANLDALGSSSEIDTGSGGLYGTYYKNQWFVNGTLMVGRSFYDNDRIALGTSNTGDTEGDQLSLQTRIGRDFKSGGWTLTPMFGTAYTSVWVEGYTESGPAALTIADDDADSFRTNLGGRINYAWETSWGKIIPEVRAAWHHEYLNDRRNINASFVDIALPGSFSTPTSNPDRDFGVFGAGVSALIGDSWTLTLDYDVEAGREEFVAHRINGGIRYAF